MNAGRALVLGTIMSACTLARPLDYLSSGVGADAGSAVDSGPTTSSSSGALVEAGSGLPADVAPNALALIGNQLFVAGKRGAKGWLGRYDAASMKLELSTDVSAAPDDGTTLLAIAPSPVGIVIAGSTHRDGSDVAILGSASADLGAPALHVVNAPGEGAAALTSVGVVNDVTWSAGTFTAGDGPHAWFAAGDTACTLPPSVQPTTTNVVRIELAFGQSDVVAFFTHAEHAVTYARYAGTDCTESGFLPAGSMRYDINVVAQPEVQAVASIGPTFYAVGSFGAGASTFFNAYGDADGKRIGNQVTQLPNTTPAFIAAAHDGDRFFVVGNYGASEAIVDGIIGATPTTPDVLRINDYKARAIAVPPAGDDALYLAGGDPNGYVLKCSKKAGCPAKP
jgi:hypothetical protein